MECSAEEDNVARETVEQATLKLHMSLSSWLRNDKDIVLHQTRNTPRTTLVAIRSDTGPLYTTLCSLLDTARARSSLSMFRALDEYARGSSLPAPPAASGPRGGRGAAHRRVHPSPAAEHDPCRVLYVLAELLDSDNTQPPTGNADNGSGVLHVSLCSAARAALSLGNDHQLQVPADSVLVIRRAINITEPTV